MSVTPIECQTTHSHRQESTQPDIAIRGQWLNPRPPGRDQVASSEKVGYKPYHGFEQAVHGETAASEKLVTAHS